MISNEQIDYVPGHLKCNMLNGDEPIPVGVTVDLRAENRTADSATLNDCASAFVAQMYSSPNTTLTDVQRSVTCAKEVLDHTMDIVEEKMLSFIDTHSIPHVKHTDIFFYIHLGYKCRCAIIKSEECLAVVLATYNLKVLGI